VKTELTRRAVLVAAASLAGITAIGAVGLFSFSEGRFVRATLHRLLGDFQMSESDIVEFTADFKAQKRFTAFFGGVTAYLLRIGELSGITPITMKVAPTRIVTILERFERSLLTNFLLTTNYLHVEEPTIDPISYFGQQQACNNPFARF
jgi:hypothetical protein